MSRHVAVISIGTNSTRVVLADMEFDVPRVDLARSIGTRIGEGVRERGRLGEEPMQRTLDAVRAHMRAVRGHYIKLFAIATSAVRRAENASAFLDHVHDVTGATVHVLSGDEEAAASYRGAITSLDASHHEELGVIDVGGGSTEYAIGSGVHPERTTSCEIGAVRLTEEVPELAGHDGPVDAAVLERARAIARERLMPLADFRRVARVALVGGSATTTAAVATERKAKIDRLGLMRTDLARTLTRLCSIDTAARKALPGMKPQRADILPAGIVILDTALDLIACNGAVATTADLLLGYALQQRDAAPAAFMAHGHHARRRQDVARRFPEVGTATNAS